MSDDNHDHSRNTDPVLKYLSKLAAARAKADAADNLPHLERRYWNLVERMAKTQAATTAGALAKLETAAADYGQIRPKLRLPEETAVIDAVAAARTMSISPAQIADQLELAATIARLKLRPLPRNGETMIASIWDLCVLRAYEDLQRLARESEAPSIAA